jgi:hypothetical protein
MRSRYLLPDLQDLPDFIERHYKEVTKEIIDLKNELEDLLKNELEEIKASPNTQQKKKEIQKKLLDILLLTISDGEKAKELHFRSILRLSTGLRRLERIKEEL